MVNEKAEKIAGKYMHYKGKEYDAYCVAIDQDGNQYVLYQQCYGEKSFWIRPYDMFFDSVLVNGVHTKRFSAVPAERQSSAAKIKKLAELVKSDSVSIKHSETEADVIITHMEEALGHVRVYINQ